MIQSTEASYTRCENIQLEDLTGRADHTIVRDSLSRLWNTVTTALVSSSKTWPHHRLVAAEEDGLGTGRP